MINPSAPGWIDKYLTEEQARPCIVVNPTEYYVALRRTGFIYGHIISIPTQVAEPIKDWLTEEVSKLALLHAMHKVYQLSIPQGNSVDFVAKSVTFYNEMHPQGFSWLHLVLPNSSASGDLEKIIAERVQTNDNLISKNFSHLVTNALLFVDVLAFRHYLIQGKIPEKYLKQMEETLVNLMNLALKTKSNKSSHDDLLIKLVEASVRYTKFSRLNTQSIESLEFNFFTDALERYYLLDIAGLALWSDARLDNEERYFLHALAQNLNLSDEFVDQSIDETSAFITTYKSEIPYFNNANPVKIFYDQTTQLVLTLMQRNKKRLVKELSESKELMVLLAHSTKRDLDKDEKKKVKKQLLDICKTIPSLTIFLIPGGSILLPILIKFIPQLLPSAFNENLEES